MAETELGKAMEKLIAAGEVVAEAIKQLKEAVETLKHSQIPLDDQPKENSE